MIRRLFLVVLSCLFPLLALAGPPDHERARAAVESGRSQPLSSLLEKVAASHPGKVLEVELENEDSRMAYEVKLLAPDGSLDVLHYDAASLELIREEKGRRRHDGRHGDDRKDGHKDGETDGRER